MNKLIRGLECRTWISIGKRGNGETPTEILRRENGFHKPRCEMDVFRAMVRHGSRTGN